MQYSGRDGPLIANLPAAVAVSCRCRRSSSARKRGTYLIIANVIDNQRAADTGWQHKPQTAVPHLTNLLKGPDDTLFLRHSGEVSKGNRQTHGPQDGDNA